MRTLPVVINEVLDPWCAKALWQVIQQSFSTDKTLPLLYGIAFVIGLDASRLGSMTTVVGRVVSAVVWSAVIDDHVQPTTVAIGSMLCESGSGCIGQRKRRIGSRDCHRRVTLNHFCGDHCLACWAAIETRPVMVNIQLTALQHFLPVRSRTFAPQQQVIWRQ